MQRKRVYGRDLLSPVSAAHPEKRQRTQILSLVRDWLWDRIGHRDLSRPAEETKVEADEPKKDENDEAGDAAMIACVECGESKSARDIAVAGDIRVRYLWNVALSTATFHLRVVWTSSDTISPTSGSAWASSVELRFRKVCRHCIRAFESAVHAASDACSAETQHALETLLVPFVSRNVYTSVIMPLLFEVI